MEESGDGPLMCIPGQMLLHETSDYIVGEGVYMRDKKIFSSMAGRIVVNISSDKKQINVVNKHRKFLVPKIDSIVVARVDKVNHDRCRCTIFKIDNVKIDSTYKGVINREDIRKTDKDKIIIGKCFKPGDVIMAKVVSMGESNSYWLSTDSNELGVILAKSKSGHQMIPISWKEMQCLETLEKEPRKTAKITEKQLNELYMNEY